MASEYTLQLKAVLDTTQVLQELRNLQRSMQSLAQVPINGKNAYAAGNRGAGLSNAAAALGGVAANLTKQFSQSSGIMSKASKDFAISARTLSKIFDLLTKSLYLLNNVITKTASYNFLKANPEMDPFNKLMPAMKSDLRKLLVYNPKFGNSNANLQLAILRNGGEEIALLLAGGAVASGNARNLNLSRRPTTRNAQLVDGFDKKMMRGMGYFIGAQTLGEVGDIASNLGYEDTGKTLNAIGSVATGAIGGAMAGSFIPGIGTGIGAAIGGTVAALKVWTSELNESAEKIKNLNKDIADRSRSNINAGNSIIHDTTMEGTIEKLSTMSEDQLNGWKKHYTLQYRNAKARSEMYAESLKLSVGSEGFNKLADLASKGQLSEKDIKSAAYANKGIEEDIKKYKDAVQEKNEFKVLNDTIDDCIAKIHAAEKAIEDEINARSALLQTNSSALHSYSNRTKLGQDAIMLNDMFGADSSMTARGKFAAISTKLDEYRQQKKDYEEAAIDIRQQMSNKGMNLSKEQMEGYLDNATAMESLAGELTPFISLMEQALGRIDIGPAPDTSYVLTLAQYGFNMGENDKTAERVEKYYSDSLTLQKEIKEKLNEGIKTLAVYLE